MKKLIIIALLPLLYAFVAPRSFVPISCINLNNDTVNLPPQNGNKRTVIALMLSLRADKQMQTWTQPLYTSLVADGVGGMMSGNMYNAKLYFVGAVKGIAKLALPDMLKKARQEVNKKYYDCFAYTNTDVEALMQHLNITDKSIPHFFVVETDGTILYQASGEYNKDKLDEITGALLN